MSLLMKAPPAEFLPLPSVRAATAGCEDIPKLLSDAAARDRGDVTVGELVGVLAGTAVRSRSTNVLRIERVPAR